MTQPSDQQPNDQQPSEQPVDDQQPTTPISPAAPEAPTQPIAPVYQPPSDPFGAPPVPGAPAPQSYQPPAVAASQQPPMTWPMQSPPPPPPSEPVDPFNTTGSTPGSPYTAPTYYPTGAAPVPAETAQQPTAPPWPTVPSPYPGYPVGPAQPPKKKHKGLIITAIVLGVLLVLCAAGGVGAFLLLNNSEGTGKPTAKEAAQEFLTAIYKDNSVSAAEKLTCKEARDRKAINSKINEVKDQNAKLKSPSYTWDAVKIADETEKSANTTVTIKLSTSDEKVSEQTVKLELVKRDGWFVCEVREQKK